MAQARRSQDYPPQSNARRFAEEALEALRETNSQVTTLNGHLERLNEVLAKLPAASIVESLVGSFFRK